MLEIAFPDWLQCYYVLMQILPLYDENSYKCMTRNSEWASWKYWINENRIDM